MITYSITGDGEAPNYFYINPTTGDITLLQSVMEFEGRSQRVRVTIQITYFYLDAILNNNIEEINKLLTWNMLHKTTM